MPRFFFGSKSVLQFLGLFLSNFTGNEFHIILLQFIKGGYRMPYLSKEAFFGQELTKGG